MMHDDQGAIFPSGRGVHRLGADFLPPYFPRTFTQSGRRVSDLDQIESCD